MTPVRQSPVSSRPTSPVPFIEPNDDEARTQRPGSPDSFDTAAEAPLELSPTSSSGMSSPTSSGMSSLASSPSPSPTPSRTSSIHSLRRPESPRMPAAPEDLSLCMRTVWMPDAMGVQRNFLADMAQLAVRYDYRLIVQVGTQTSVERCRGTVQALSGLSDEELERHVGFVEAGDAFTSWGEDNKILTLPDVNGRPTILYPPHLHRTMFSMAEAFVRDEGYHPYSPSFQGAVSQRNEGEDARAFAMRVGMKSRRTVTYLEGGNVLTGQLANGQPYALVGRDSLVISTFALRADDKQRHTPDAVQARREKLERDGFYTAARVEEAMTKLKQARHTQTSWSEWMRGLKITADEAKNFCAEMDLTHDVMARDLGLSPQNVFFVAQPDFHIDMHMRPMFAGEVLLNDPRTSVTLLEGILAMEGIPLWQREELNEMLSNAQTAVVQSAKTVDNIAMQLDAAGLTCRRIPGVLESDRRHANFMNGIPGRAPDGSTFYFTNASSITWLQRAIMHYFTQAVGIEHVEFVGGAGGSAYSANAAEESLEQSGGLDCREVHSSAAFDLPDVA